ncbi:MAG: hypothetical protein JWM36_4056 [Hyphomicrobiales bacterium]|nr:hypothetical protein [Hyphomicrobiales bacterium]
MKTVFCRQASLATSCITMLAAVAVIWSALGNISDLVTGADAAGLAAAIESPRKELVSRPLTELIEGFELTSRIDQLESICLDQVSRAVSTIRLARLENARRTSDEDVVTFRAKAALRTVEKRLLCSPADGAAWLNRARLLDEFGGSVDDVNASLQVSYWVGPSERWIMLPRFAFVSPKIENGDLSLELEFKSDLNRLVLSFPPELIAEIYVGSGPVVRSSLASEIRRQPENRQMRIVNAVDRMGVSIKFTP